MSEAEFFEEANGGLALHERVEHHLQIILLSAEADGRLNQGLSDAATAVLGVDPQASDFAHGVLVVLNADHSHDLSLWRLGDPEVAAGGAQVGAGDIVDVVA